MNSIPLNMKDLSELEEKIKITFTNKDLLQNAFVHRSSLNENSNIKSSNERLEFLGDSVLSLLVSTELFQLFPLNHEGKLTTMRSLLVKTRTLAQLSQELDLGQFLIMSHGEERSGGRENISILADTFEALLGAIYLDQGLPVVKEFLQTMLFPLIPQVEQKEDLLDYKSNLQELVQNKAKVSPQYKVISEVGPDHDKTFTIGVYLDKKLLAKGEGKSKQAGEQQAAKLALEKGL